MLIRSTSNLQIKYIRTLCEKRKARKVHYEFFVEGVRAVSEAYSHGWNVKKTDLLPIADSIRLGKEDSRGIRPIYPSTSDRKFT
jgi:hypothetical protein